MVHNGLQLITSGFKLKSNELVGIFIKKKIEKKDVFSGILLGLFAYFITNTQEPVLINDTIYLVIRFVILIVVII